MQICHIFADGFSELNSTQFRGIIFIDALNRAGHSASLIGVENWMKDTCREKLASADLIVVERILVEEAVERASFWKSRGKAIVIDIDDSYSLLQPFEESGNQAAKFWKLGMVDVNYGNGITYSKKLAVSPLDQFRQGLKYCTGLTSPSRILNEDWKMYAPTWVLPNYLDSRRYLPHKNIKIKSRADELIIGWGGSMSHKLSFERSGVAIALRRVLKRHKNVKFMLCGDKRILDIVKLPPEQVVFRNYVTYQEWPKSAKSFDIGLAPLQGRYDSSRSEIKAEEYSTLAIPFVATGCPTYERFEQKNIGLYVQDSLEYDAATVEKRAVEWEQKLEDIITHYADYKQKALDDSVNLAPYWWVDNRVQDIVKTYESIIAHG
jgi:hypothetical protein